MEFFRKHNKVFVKVLVILMIGSFLISLLPQVMFLFSK